MGNKRRYQKLRVQMKYVPAPDVRERLSRALGILLKATARGSTKSEDSIKGKKGPGGNGLTTGEEGDPHD